MIGFSALCGTGHTLLLNLYSGINLTETLGTGVNGSTANFQEEYLDVVVRIVANTLLGLAGQSTETKCSTYVSGPIH